MFNSFLLASSPLTSHFASYLWGEAKLKTLSQKAVWRLHRFACPPWPPRNCPHILRYFWIGLQWVRPHLKNTFSIGFQPVPTQTSCCESSVTCSVERNCFSSLEPFRVIPYALSSHLPLSNKFKDVDLHICWYFLNQLQLPTSQPAKSWVSHPFQSKFHPTSTKYLSSASGSSLRSKQPGRSLTNWSTLLSCNGRA